MNNDKLIFECLYILIADPDGNNEQVRRHLMKELNRVLNPPKEQTQYEKTEPFFGNDALSQLSEVKKDE